MLVINDEKLAVRLEAVAAVGRIAVGRDLTLASGGNISCRTEGGFAITNTGAWLDRLGPDTFGLVPLEGPPDSDQPEVSSEWRMHQGAYRVRPDAEFVLHLHPQMCVMIDALSERIRYVTLDHAYYANSYGRVPYLASGSSELAEAASEAIEQYDTVILAHHGSITVADDIDFALRRLMNLDQAAEMTFRLMQLGRNDGDFPADPATLLTV